MFVKKEFNVKGYGFIDPDAPNPRVHAVFKHVGKLKPVCNRTKRIEATLNEKPVLEAIDCKKCIQMLEVHDWRQAKYTETETKPAPKRKEALPLDGLRGVHNVDKIKGAYIQITCYDGRFVPTDAEVGPGDEFYSVGEFFEHLKQFKERFENEFEVDVMQFKMFLDVSE